MTQLPLSQGTPRPSAPQSTSTAGSHVFLFEQRSPMTLDPSQVREALQSASVRHSPQTESGGSPMHTSGVSQAASEKQAGGTHAT